MNQQPLVLTFDIGTQSMRGLLVNQTGFIEDSVQIKYDTPYYSKNQNWAEQDPDFYYEILCDVCDRLYMQSEARFDRIKAVTITCIRDTVLCLDEDMKPLRDAILWLDKREVNSPKYPFNAKEKFLFKLAKVDKITSMQYKISTCNWIMENEKDIWEKTDKFVLLPTYMNYKLTGVLKDSVANMIGHLPFDYKNRRWMSARGLTRCLYDIPLHMLCNLVDPGETIGHITGEVSQRTHIPKGLPLIATGSDKSCESLGLGVMKKHQSAISFGTASTIQFTTKKYFEPVPYVPSYPSVIKDMYNGEVQIYRGYWLLEWYKKEFGAEDYLASKQMGMPVEVIWDNHLNDVNPGCDGLMLQPLWSPGVTTPNARGSMIGFTDTHTRRHIYRAIVEGINYALMEGLYRMEKRSSQKITEILVAGGGSKSDEVCQIASDMFGLPVKRIQTHEACSIGSSIIAFMAIGTFKTHEEAIESMVQVKDIFTPNAENTKLYKELYDNVYSQMSDALTPLYKKINEITKK